MTEVTSKKLAGKEIDDTVISRASRYAWAYSGDGMRTSLGVRQREAVQRAWLDGYKDCLRDNAPDKKRKGKE